MKVSVITVVYNGEKYLRRAIESVLNQNYHNIEYIIIDGGSRDSSISIIKEYESRITYWCSESDNGIADAFNKGIKKATGELVGILNCDDWYEADTIAKAVEACQLHKADVLHGKMQYWINEEKEYVFTANHDLLLKEMVMNHPTVFVRREIYEKYGSFEEKWHYAMDYELLLRLYVSGVKFHYIPEITANMQLGGASDLNWTKAFWESFLIKKKHLRKSFSPFCYFIYMLLRKFISKTMPEIGLGFLQKFYRRYFSQTVKIKE